MPNQKQSVFGTRARSKPRKELAKLKGNYNYALFAVSPRLDPGLQARVRAQARVSSNQERVRGFFVD